MCQGKPIRVWVDEIGRAQYPARELAEEQLQTVGPTAVSAILEALATTPRRNQINDWWTKVWSNLPKSIQAITPQPRLQFRPDRRMWITSLSRLGPHDRRVVVQIISELANKDSEVRFFAASSLGQLAPGWAEEPAIQQSIIQALARTLNDPAFNVRGAAAYALAKCGPAAQSTLPTLLQALRSPGSMMLWEPLWAVACIGGDSNTIVAAVAPLLQSTQAVARAYAAYTLCRVTSDTNQGLPILVDLLCSGDDNTAPLAASMLGRLGPLAITALLDLEHAAESSSSDLRISAAKALWKISGDPGFALKVSQPTLMSGRRPEQIETSALLVELGPKAAPALPGLIVALDNQDFLIRHNAVRALGAIGPPAAQALPQLQLLLNDPFPSIRKAAAESIRLVSGR
jgi:HEAT repeat protein